MPSNPNEWDDVEPAPANRNTPEWRPGQWEWVCLTCGGHGAVENPVFPTGDAAIDHRYKKPLCKQYQIAVARRRI